MAEMMLLANWLRRGAVSIAARLLLLTVFSVTAIVSAHAESVPRSQPNAPMKLAPARADEPAQHPAAATPKRSPAAQQAQRPEAGPALRGMIGQMILIGFPGQRTTEEWPSRAARMIRDGRIGGVVLFGQNVADPGQLKKLVASLVDGGRPLRPFIAIDQEGGTIQRLTRAKGFVGLASARDIARMDQGTAYRLYRRTASELADLGINLNFGPVVDLNTNAANPAIARLARSYDRNPEKVIDYARQFIDAHDQKGVLTSAKHFPGHGSAQLDPHNELVDIGATWQEAELEPFRDLVSDQFVEMIMVGHLIHPRFSDGNRPASLSRRTIEGELRGGLGFQGLVVTDDLDMGAIRDRYSIEEAAVMAVEAGSDLLIVANNKNPDPMIADRLIQAIADAVARGRIPPQKIEAAYQRIVAAKKKLESRRSTPSAAALQQARHEN
jgi:beta-N-acetylhexosaminidase